jgi:hypothetical protein
VQKFDFGALDESKFQQAAFKLDRGQIVGAFRDIDCMDAPAEPAHRLTEWQGLRNC